MGLTAEGLGGRRLEGLGLGEAKRSHGQAKESDEGRGLHDGY